MLKLHIFQKNYFKQIVIFLASFLSLGFLSLMIFGFDTHYHFFTHVQSLPDVIGHKYIFMSFSFVLRHMFYDNSDLVSISNISLLIFLLTLWYFRKRHCNDMYKNQSALLTDFFLLIIILVMVLPTSWMFYHSLFIPIFYFIIFLFLENKLSLKDLNIFLILFPVFSFWEIIVYQIPIPVSGMTMHQIFSNRLEHPALFSIFSSLPFFFNFIFFLWLIGGYKKIIDALSHYRF